MYELKKIGEVFTSKFVGTGPSSYEKRIYRAAVSRRLRNTALVHALCGDFAKHLCHSPHPEDPTSAVLGCLFNIQIRSFPRYLQAISSICNPMTRHVVVSDAEIP
jgi:hypothetical protein